MSSSRKTRPARKGPRGKTTRQPDRKTFRKRKPAAAGTRKMGPQTKGQAFGQQLGAHLGGIVGHGAAQLLKSITGFGDYSLKSNTLMSGGMSPPQIANSAVRGGYIIRHREYIMDITSTTAFTPITLDINPGLVGTFPWLSQIADSFEQYSMRGLIFEFKTTSSDALLSTNASTALGSVIMATQYNTLSPPFPDKRTMENYEFACSSKPSLTFIHPIECAASQTSISELYIRTGAVPAGADGRLYDLGQFTIATAGMQAAGGVLGELWCSFEIELYKPKLLAEIGYELLTDHWRLTAPTTIRALGNGSLLEPNSSLGTTITAAGQTLNFPPTFGAGSYMINYYQSGTTAVTFGSPTLTPTNCVLETVWFNDTSTVAETATGTTNALNCFINFVVSITAPGASVQFVTNTGTLPQGTTNGDLWINQINGGIIT